MQNEQVSRFLGGPPLAIVARLVLLSILVGVVLHAVGFDPWNILQSLQALFNRSWNLGFDVSRGFWRYFLLWAAIVVPIWLIMRLAKAPRGRDAGD
ncbi:MAG: DUF6460 domain-containing protein [Xanthobacteraceae bacterium]